MEYESLVILSYIAAAISVVFLIVGVVLFFKLKIIDVIGDLSGSKQRKAIENIKANNKSNVKKSFSTAGTSFGPGIKKATISKRENVSNKVEENFKNTSSVSRDFNNKSDDDGVTEVLGINVSDNGGDAETSVLGIQTVNEDYDDENVTTILGVQNVIDDKDEEVTSVLGVQSIDEDRDFEDGITLVHGKTIK